MGDSSTQPQALAAPKRAALGQRHADRPRDRQSPFEKPVLLAGPRVRSSATLLARGHAPCDALRAGEQLQPWAYRPSYRRAIKERPKYSRSAVRLALAVWCRTAGWGWRRAIMCRTCRPGAQNGSRGCSLDPAPVCQSRNSGTQSDSSRRNRDGRRPSVDAMRCSSM